MGLLEEDLFREAANRMTDGKGRPVLFGEVAARIAKEKRDRDIKAVIQQCEQAWPSFRDAIIKLAVEGKTEIKVYGSFVTEVLGECPGITWLQEKGLSTHHDGIEWFAKWEEVKRDVDG